MLNEGARGEDRRRRIPTELQLTLSSRTLNEHWGTCSGEIEIDPKQPVDNLRIHAPNGKVHGVAVEDDGGCLTDPNPMQIEFIDVRDEFHASLRSHLR